MPEDVPDWGAVEALVQARLADPFGLLGPHDTPAGRAIRAFLPEASSVTVIERQTGLPIGKLARVHPAGFWSGIVDSRAPYRLRIASGGDAHDIEDPYSFGPALGDLDVHLLGEGRHHDYARQLGAHLTTLEGVPGVRFAVWAPNARRVSVVGDFNRWDGRVHPMRLRYGAGIWEIFLPRLTAGAVYKYEILGVHGELLVKADPVAWATEAPPATASVVATGRMPHWTDQDWMAQRGARAAYDAPVSIYEVHAFSWQPAVARGPEGWRALAERLVPYAARLGFTHIELMPIMEHPFGGSWGYQPLGQFAPSARLGPPEDFAHFVNACHGAGLGVILDWVPAHFPTDAYGLARFDGTALYEHEDPREGFHRDWNTLIYNLGRNEVRNFLLGSALHWLETYHADGLRVDAVASMLYRDYSRPAGEWIPNRYGGRENLEAVDFLRELSYVLRARVPGSILVAEESTAWPGVSRPPEEGGLGFTYKWNMGWMHDTLHYMEEDPVHRRWHHGEITFGLIYAFSEHFVLPLSHDEVVHLKGSLLGKMPGDDWQKFANLRAYYGFMWTHPGKKLLFMGGEFGQRGEWNHDSGPEWWALDDPRHRGVQALIRDLNRLYREERALHVRDAAPEGFRWVVLHDADQSVYAYLRFGEENDPPVLIVCNFTPVPRYAYRLGVPRGGAWRELLNTDAETYGGSNVGNSGAVEAVSEPMHDLPASLELTLPPLGTIILRAA
ncbi:MAG TPA: 1,4-alpha-glucan branching protein GlgB [Acetobacteraceae bacterium]|nr:1,4-alpha-glucan branching protein GlgB [Acetobacteraceae bacterium]